MKIIETKGLTKDYGGGRGVFGLDFEVNEGEVMGFLGPNGAGKTTTIRQLMGFIQPDAGSATVFGLPCFEQAAQIQKELGYLPGEPAFMNDMTGTAFLHFLAQMKGLKSFARAQQLMQQFELDANAKIGRMSKGTKQKVGIVAAFMASPRLLVLDEPTSGLDPLMQNRFIELILQEKQRGATILMSSHIFEEVERTCDRTVIIRAGRIVAVEQMEELRRTKRKTFATQFAVPADATAFAAAWAGGDATVNGDTVTLTVTGSPDAFLKQVAAYPVKDLDLHRESLEELFLHYYGAENGGQKA